MTCNSAKASASAFQATADKSEGKQVFMRRIAVEGVEKTLQG